MSLLECLVGIALCVLLLNPLLHTSANLVKQQIAYEKTQLLESEAERALELMARAIRMAGYRKVQNMQAHLQQTAHQNKRPLEIHQKSGYRGSDGLTVRYALSGETDFDCLGNHLTSERTNHHLALQGFSVDRQASAPKGARVNGGSLICHSLDRQGRIQKTSLMNGVNGLWIEELKAPLSQSQRAFQLRLEMTDGAYIQKEFSRTVSTRNLL
ncbi:hypothetical protein [Polynucleobacter sp. UK-Kesae-W10]|uniref:hypothetical protein n=1 Tax=Polynucleobacter sp. UK-Kesae-W10 TaxID=1819738 RepID=UPI002104A74D|nr:hypothetical protein [Polynucleobacter sp. UK-Kesae-W10]